MNKAEVLHKKYEDDLKKLQVRCKHKKLTDWVDVYWAPGHHTGMLAKFCKECNKRVRTKKCKPELHALTMTSNSGNWQFINTSQTTSN